jgi:hypothetical protein
MFFPKSPASNEKQTGVPKMLLTLSVPERHFLSFEGWLPKRHICQNDLIYLAPRRLMTNISSTTPYCNQICEFDVDIEKEQHSITNSEKYYDLPEQISRNIMRKTYPQMIFSWNVTSFYLMMFVMQSCRVLHWYNENRLFVAGTV